MKKYRLLKDLPLYPAGTICEFKEEVVDSDGVNGVWGEVVMEVGKPYRWGEYVMNHEELSKIQEDDEFEEWFEDVDKPLVFTPLPGQLYYYLMGNMTINSFAFDPESERDQMRVSVGNCFKTHEEAELAIAKLQALRRLRNKGLRFLWTSRYSDSTSGFIQIDFDSTRISFNNNHEFDEETQADLDLVFKDIKDNDE